MALIEHLLNSIRSFLGNFLFLKPTPTFENPFVGEETSIHPPLGWTLAGFLLILLISMLYAEIKRAIQQKILKRKKKSSGG
ncbi:MULTISPECIES: hypothetical protein [Anaerolinea]|uniref:hypothetical protein n=1 Tax=Anaerolinea TaxID=233189 RepID=UPI00261CFF8D|nr:hypothetical protein [Anaerolinea thermophila]